MTLPKDLEGQLDKILSQAFTDGASDTMWVADRHVEIYAAAKAKLTHLIEAYTKDRVKEVEAVYETKLYRLEKKLDAATAAYKKQLNSKEIK